MRSLIRLFGVALPAVTTGAIVLVVFADVIARNFFQAPIPWAHDLAVVMMAVTVWFGLVGACMSDQMFGIAIIVDRLPQRAQVVAMVAADLLTILIAAAVVHAAYAQISTARFTTFLALGWPKWIIAAFIAAGMIMIIVVRLLDIVARLRGEKNFQ